MKIIKKLFVIIPIVLIILAFFLIIKISFSIRNNKVPNIFGYSFSVVGSGSMEPDIKIGDFIVVKKQMSYNIGEVVSFYYDINNDGIKDSVTHEIINIKDETYTLRGIAADEDDIQIINEDDIYGKVVFKSTSLGKILTLKLVNNKSFIFLGLIFCLGIFCVYQVINIIKMIKEGKKEN